MSRIEHLMETMKKASEAAMAEDIKLHRELAKR